MGQSIEIPREHAKGDGRAARPAIGHLGALRSALGASFVWRQEAGWKAYAGTTVMVLLALSLGLALQQYLESLNIALVFLTAVLGSAIAYGLWPSLFASLLSVFAYNFFFLPPLYTTTITDPENVIAMVSFVIVAVIVSNLTSRVRSQAIAARQRAETTEQLYLFTRELSAAVTLEDLARTAISHIARMLNLRAVLLLGEAGAPEISASSPPEDGLAGHGMSEVDQAAARWCWANNRPAGRDCDAQGEASRLFLPMHTSRGVVAVIGLAADRPGALLSADQRRLLDALCDQAALAIERVHLARDVDRARLVAETDRLRTALLTSISHDLRTPLASILGSATSLKTQPEALDETAKREMISTIQEEAERLNRFIGNLLDMTRLESGAIVPRSSMADLSEIVGSALERASRILEAHPVEVRLPADLPMLALDVVLFEQVLFNLLDNAAKYAPARSTIRLQAQRKGEEVQLQIIDEGEGIPAVDLDRIFDKFYRVHAADRRRAGTGLGLAICRGFVEAMGGRIEAGNRPDRAGAVFTLVLPVPRQEPALAEAVL